MDTIERFAIRAALGNNGGTWAEHYTEAQKEHWRGFVRAMREDLRAEMVAGMSIEFEEPRANLTVKTIPLSRVVPPTQHDPVLVTRPEPTKD